MNTNRVFLRKTNKVICPREKDVFCELNDFYCVWGRGVCLFLYSSFFIFLSGGLLQALLSVELATFLFFIYSYPSLDLAALPSH